MKTPLLYFIVIALLFSGNANAQLADTLPPIRKDSLLTHSSSKATLLSAILPGAGQFYNKKYWKMPIIYSGFAALIYAISFNQNNYKTFQQAYRYRADKDSSTVDAYVGRYTDDNLLTLRDYYRRNRDFCYILSGALYVLNVLDAYVDAELFRFDISDDLSLRGEPFIINYNDNSIAGARLTLNFK